MGRRTLLLIASILIAAVGTALIGLYVRGADDRAQQTEGTFPTLVATKEIAPNTSIEAAVNSMELKAVPGRMGAGGYTGSGASAAILEDQKGKVTTETIYPEQTVLKSMFGAAGAATANGFKNARGVSVEMTDPGRAAGLLSPGSHVTIYLIPKNTDPDLETAQKITPNRVTGQLKLDPPIKLPVILDDALVMRIGNSTTSSTTTTNGTQTDDVPRTIVTLDLTEADADAVVAAQALGELYFAVHKVS